MISQTSLAEVTASPQLFHELLLFIGTYRQMRKWAKCIVTLTRELAEGFLSDDLELTLVRHKNGTWNCVAVGKV